MKPNSASTKSILTGAAFLMATSAIGPGFLTQTTVFTQSLKASFGFVVLVSVLLDLGAQLNIWRIIALHEKKVPEIANGVLPGAGTLLAVLVVMGGLAFNIGNIAGCGLGLSVLTGWSAQQGAALSTVFALVFFYQKDVGRWMDGLTRWLGAAMIVVTLWMVVKAQPPLVEAVQKTFWPDQWDALAILTLVGGTVGGYISFAGGHRLLDAGIKGVDHLQQVNRSAQLGIWVTGTMRMLLFLAVLGVVYRGGGVGAENPTAAVFRAAAGWWGERFFGVVMWCAAITSVIGATYTSLSFLKPLHPFFGQYEKHLTAGFVLFSAAVFLWVGQPVKVLVTVGALNGLVLPLGMVLLLLSLKGARKKYGWPYPLALEAMGWCITLTMGALAVMGVQQWLAK